MAPNVKSAAPSGPPKGQLPRPTADEIAGSLVVLREVPKPQKPYVEIITPQPGETLRLIAVTQVFMVATHYLFGRTWPHLAKNCVCEHYQVESRVKGYATVYQVKDGRYYVLELPERPLLVNPDLCKPEKVIRQRLVVTRRGSKPNGRVTVKVEVPDETQFKTCKFLQIDPLQVMAEKWARATKDNTAKEVETNGSAIPIPTKG